MYDILTGAIALASLLIALFFLRFWRDTRDRFFLYFAASFTIEGAHRIYASLTHADREDAALHYVIRLIAYGLILWAILEKNWPRHKEDD